MNSADKAMVLVRKQVRAQDELRLINKRAYSIFRNMQVRAKEVGRLQEIDFTVDWLREKSREIVSTPCRWCDRSIKAAKFSWDHKIPVGRGGTFAKENLDGVCSTCNGQKGNLTYQEFSGLRLFLATLAVEAKGDILRRLGLGARWRS